MIKRRAIGPDQIQHGNKIECHVAGSCATYLDADLNWQISDCTTRRHLSSPTDATTGRDVWTQRPLTVGVNTYGARQDLVTIRESSSLGKHTEWTITPIDPYSLRRKSQPVDTEYDLDEQVVQATSNNTTRIFTPYTGQDSISYEITAPPGGEIREENGQLNAYRDNWYLFTIPDPTIYDADKQLITDAEGLPVRCYSIRLETVSAEDGVYIVHKERCGDVPDDCAWVDVEISTTYAYFGKSRKIGGISDYVWDNVRNSTSPSLDFSNINANPIISKVEWAANEYVVYRAICHINLPSNADDAISASMTINSPFISTDHQISIHTTPLVAGETERDEYWQIANYSSPIAIRSLAAATDKNIDIGIPLISLDYIKDNAGTQGVFTFANYTYDYLDVILPGAINSEARYNISDISLSLTIDPGHTGAFKPAEIVGSIPSEGGVIQVDFDGSDPVGLDIANNLSDTSGATDIHFRTVDASGDPDALIPFQRLSASGSGSSFAYSAKLDMPAGETEFAVCYGPNNPPSSDYVDFSSTVSGTAINTGAEDPGDGFWDWYSAADSSAEIVKSVTSNIFGDIIKPIM